MGLILARSLGEQDTEGPEKETPGSLKRVVF